MENKQVDKVGHAGVALMQLHQFQQRKKKHTNSHKGKTRD